MLMTVFPGSKAWPMPSGPQSTSSTAWGPVSMSTKTSRPWANSLGVPATASPGTSSTAWRVRLYTATS